MCAVLRAQSLVVILLTDSTVITCVIAPWFKWNWVRPPLPPPSPPPALTIRVSVVCLPQLGCVHCALFSVITFLAAASHVACMTTCPGVMPRVRPQPPACPPFPRSR